MTLNKSVGMRYGTKRPYAGRTMQPLMEAPLPMNMVNGSIRWSWLPVFLHQRQTRLLIPTPRSRGDGRGSVCDLFLHGDVSLYSLAALAMTSPYLRQQDCSLLVPVSKLRTAIVNLFPDTDIGLTRMRTIDALITTALTTVQRETEQRLTQNQSVLRHLTQEAIDEAVREEREKTTKRLLEISQGAIRCEVEDEREACARVAEGFIVDATTHADPVESNNCACKEIATTIRGRQ